MNLSSAIEFGRNTEERALNLFSTIAHEVFHAAFGNYQKKSKTWKNFYSKFRSPIFTLLELTMNEGIAYNFSLEQKLGNYNFENWYDKISSSFEKYNLIATQLITEKIGSKEIFEKIKDANTSGFWENYGSVVGFVIAKSIDKNFGREKLIETIENGAFDFFQKYFECCEMDKNLPRLSEEILKIISKKK